VSRQQVIVVGAGMVGATLACLLGRSGFGVTLLEATPPETDWRPGSVDLRVSALTAASERVFDGIGAWDAMAALGVSPFRDMRVWDAAGSGEVHFNSADVGEPRLGHIVENRVVQRALMERIHGLADVRLRCPAEISALHVDDEAATVELSDGVRLRAGLVVAADGANSRTRGLAGIGVRGWSYDQKAVVAVVRTERPHEDTAWQRFLPDGVLAFLPLRDGRCSIVWSTAPAHADELVDIEDEAFRERLARAFDHRLGGVTEAGPRAAFPLRLQHAASYVGARLALIGDAAHAIHPLAGQGVNLGVLDAAALAEVVLAASAEGRDIGARTTLRRYERWRKGDNLLMMAAMDGFKRLFAARFGPLRLARNAGLSLFDAATPIKRLVMQHAMGLRGDLPAIARSARI
jgi:2-octaprenylphenol hydroxylase